MSQNGGFFQKRYAFSELGDLEDFVGLVAEDNARRESSRDLGETVGWYVSDKAVQEEVFSGKEDEAEGWCRFGD